MTKGFKLMVENVPYDWPNQFIKGSEVRGLGPGIPDNMDLFVKRQGKAGQIVKADDVIDLDEKGLEKFYAQDSSSEAGI